MREVFIIQRRLTNYRVPLFSKMRERLANFDVRLRLLCGEATPNERLKGDGGDLDWAEHIPSRYFFGNRVCWQNFGQQVKNAELIIVTQENSLLYNLVALTINRPKRIAFWGHGRNMQSNSPEGSRERFKRWTTLKADWWFAYTGLSTKFIAHTGFALNRITNLENAIDTTVLKKQFTTIAPHELLDLRTQLGWNDARIAVFLGSLYVEKRLEFLLEAAYRLHSLEPDFRLLIVGDGPSREMVKHFCVKHPWCVWVGTKHDRDKTLYLSLADVILNPGAVGLVMLDSFIAKVPLVTTDCGRHGPEIDYLIQNENGVITSDNLQDYVAGVRKVLVDDSYRAKLRYGCAVAAKHYTIENMVDRFCSGILDCLALEK